MMKKLITVLLFLVVPILTAQAQNPATVKTIYGGSTQLNYMTFTSIDSLNVYLSNAFDLSNVDGQALYITYEFISAGGTSDSLSVAFQPVIPELNASSVTPVGYFAPIVGDSIIIVGATASSISTTTGASTVSQTTKTLTKWSMLYRLVVRNIGSVVNRAGKSLKIAIYAKTNDVQLPAKMLSGARY